MLGFENGFRQELIYSAIFFFKIWAKDNCEADAILTGLVHGKDRKTYSLFPECHSKLL